MFHYSETFLFYEAPTKLISHLILKENPNAKYIHAPLTLDLFWVNITYKPVSRTLSVCVCITLRAVHVLHVFVFLFTDLWIFFHWLDVFNLFLFAYLWRQHYMIISTISEGTLFNVPILSGSFLCVIKTKQMNKWTNYMMLLYSFFHGCLNYQIILY